jgi:hypothetical protein
MVVPALAVPVPVHRMAVPRVALRQSDAGDAEGEREGGRDGKNVPLQKHLPTDFAD